MGGSIINASQYESSTHLCLIQEVKTAADVKLVSLAGKKLVTQEWVYRCCADNAIYDEPELDSKATMVVSTGKRPRSLPRLTEGSAAVRRLCFDEEKIDEDKVRRQLHHLFFCENDQSENSLSLAAYGDKMKGKAGIRIQCPGSAIPPAYYTATVMEVKYLVKDVYLLLKALQEAGYSLGGAFQAKNFMVIDGLSRKKAMFGQLEKGSLQRKTDDAKKNDTKSYKIMIRKEVFRGILQPHDITVWLSLMESPDLGELMPVHLCLLEDQDACNRFLGLCDTFKDEIEEYRFKEKKEVFKRMVNNLKAYDDWKTTISDPDGNNYLRTTLNHSLLPNSPFSYADDVSCFLRMIRNSRHHAARGKHRQFLLIIAHNFPNLVSDLQVEMFKEGYKA